MSKRKDFGAPPVEVLNEVVNHIDNEIQSGKPVIVHCNGGSGRMGMVESIFNEERRINSGTSRSESERD